MKTLQYAEINIQMYLDSNNMKGSRLMTNDKIKEAEITTCS